MKTDRRHELQTNVLADWIGKHIQQWQGQSKTILAVILLIIAAVIAGTFLVQDQATRAQASWNQLFQAFGNRDPQALSAVAASNPGTTAGAWAALAEADLKLAEGISDLYTNRENAKANLDAAEQSYLYVDKPGTDKMLRERAWFGLAQVYESKGDVSKAKETYGRLVSGSPTSALGKEAQSRIEDLNDESTEKWYNWFANQTPRPPAIPGMPNDLGLPNLPSDLQNLSDRPDLSVPQFPPVGPDANAAPSTNATPEAGPDLNSPDAAATPEATEPAPPTEEDAPAESKPETTTPPATENAPAEPAPAETTPAESTPAASDAPAEEADAASTEAPE